MNNQSGWNAKKAWAQGLQVGDIVCDCRYKHVKIASIQHIYLPAEDGGGWMGANLTFEDGMTCSAMGCCDRADDHSESSHVNSNSV